MNNSRYLFIMLFAAAILFSLSGCVNAPEITATYVDETLPLAWGDAQQSVAPSPSAKIDLPPGMTVEEELNADLDSDGAEETIIICSSESEAIQYEDYITLYVSDDSGLYKAGVTDGSYKSAFLTSTDNGDPCIIINTAFIDNNASIFSFSGIEPVLMDSFSGLITNVSGTEVTVENDTDVFGSWYYTRDFTLSDDFTLSPVSDLRITMDGKEPLHTIRKLPVEMLIGEVYVPKTLDADTYIYPVSTDGKSHVMFRLQDGSEGRITYILKDYDYYVEGIHEEEYFDNIGYWD